MQVKKQKDTLFWIHVNLLKILKSYCQFSILSIFHIIITVHLPLLIIITTNIVIRLLYQKLMVSALRVTYNLVIIFNMYPLFKKKNITML